jgi:hypothetical protein
MEEIDSEVWQSKLGDMLINLVRFGPLKLITFGIPFVNFIGFKEGGYAS